MHVCVCVSVRMGWRKAMKLKDLLPETSWCLFLLLLFSSGGGGGGVLAPVWQNYFWEKIQSVPEKRTRKKKG